MRPSIPLTHVTLLCVHIFSPPFLKSYTFHTAVTFRPIRFVYWMCHTVFTVVCIPHLAHTLPYGIHCHHCLIFIQASFLALLGDVKGVTGIAIVPICTETYLGTTYGSQPSQSHFPSFTWSRTVIQRLHHFRNTSHFSSFFKPTLPPNSFSTSKFHLHIEKVFGEMGVLWKP